MKDFDFEPIPGLPGTLPAGETLLWQGAPDWWCLARRVFHVPLIAGYLGIFIVWRLISAAYDHQSLLEAARGLMLMVVLITVCCGILAALAYATARTTVYSITSERLIMRYGIALPMALNIPFAKVDTAAIRGDGKGCGDIPLRLMKGEKIAYLMLWPHARPWRLTQPEPMLRGIPHVAKASAILARALAAAASRPAERTKAAAAAPADVMPPSRVKARRPASGASRDAVNASAGEPVARPA